MTALDRALIKALHQPSSRSGKAPGETPRVATLAATSPAVPLSQALAELAKGEESWQSTELGSATAVVDHDLSSTSGRETGGEGYRQSAVAEPTTAPVGPTIAALLDEAFPATAATQPTTAAVSQSIAAWLDEALAFQTTTVTGPATAVVSSSIAALASHAQTFQATTVTVESPSPTELPCEEPAGYSEKQPESEAELPVRAEEDDQVGPTPPDAASHPEQVADQCEPANVACEAPAETAIEAPAEPAWRPLLQVDRVIWPTIHGRLQTTAAIQEMADGLLSICASGSKVLGLTSCAPGEGVTTILLAAARKLLSQGRKVALVDANWGNPQLAQSLGLLPQIGWEETLCGGLPLEEVVIESLADGLAVLPVREPSASEITEAQIAASLDILAREFDVVLVDLGPLAQVEEGDSPAHEGASAHRAAARMDAVILVQNVRLTTPSRLAAARGRLAASNLRCAGTIQNFVAG
jgi:Mrp family chromosome partitioning ATPase